MAWVKTKRKRLQRMKNNVSSEFILVSSGESSDSIFILDQGMTEKAGAEPHPQKLTGSENEEEEGVLDEGEAASEAAEEREEKLEEDGEEEMEANEELEESEEELDVQEQSHQVPKPPDEAQQESSSTSRSQKANQASSSSCSTSKREGSLPDKHHGQPKDKAVESPQQQQHVADPRSSATAAADRHGAERAAMDKAEFDLEAASREMFGKLNSAVDAGIKSLGKFTQHPPAAGSSLSKLAEGLTSGFNTGLGWWNNMDSQAKQSRQTLESLTSKPLQSLNKDSALLQLFGLNEDEQVVEQFPCKMLQTYGCRHNSFTPVLQMAFQGTMHLTDKHLCFSIEERGKQLPVKIALSNISSATRQLSAQKGAGDLLHLELGSKETYVAFRFESGGALDSALALIEHLTEG